jgi:threonylcarbamoyladenosine tRNA methylthiotransferase MtaB
MGGKYRLTTLGCKVNQYESQHIREVLQSHGLTPAGPDEPVDVAVINTCAVTTEAARKNRQAIRSAARVSAREIVVVGCGAAADRERLETIDGVTAVFGHDVDVGIELRALLRDRLGIRQPNHATERYRRSNGYEVSMNPPGPHEAARPASVPVLTSSRETIPLGSGDVKPGVEMLARIEAFAGHQRAFLKVQDGCDASCTYCIIPRLRPRLRWKPVETAVAEARQLVGSGHKEIVLTGIFLGAYGRGTAIRRRFRPGRQPLAGLVAALARVDGLVRLRLSSLEPGDVNDDLLDVLATAGPCVPHLHLPLQSGSPEVLRRMNRQYSVDAFVEMIDRVRTALNRPALTTDLIVGFPGETEADFEASLAMCRDAGFCKIHTFPFSARPGTAAARWGRDFVPASIVRDRVRRLGELERRLSYSFRRQFVGCTERVIVESRKTRAEGPEAVWNGRCDRYFEVHFSAAAPVAPGDHVEVSIERVTATRTHGAIRSEPSRRTIPLAVLAT